MAFSEGRNAYLAINRPQAGGAVRVYPASGTVECYVGPPTGGRGISDFVPLPIETGSVVDPTDVIVFDVPTSQATEIVLKGNEELTITGADSQVNGIYQNVGRPNKSRSTESDIPTSFRLYVRRIRSS